MRSERKFRRFMGSAVIVVLALTLSVLAFPATDGEAMQGVEMLGEIGPDSSLLRSPGRLAYAGGVLYVVDSYRNRIQTFDSMGNHLSVIGFTRPSAVAAAPDGTLYIGSNIDYSVAIYKNGTVSGYLGDGSYEYLSISDISLDSVTGDIYVADNVANAVIVYNASGAQVRIMKDMNGPRSVEVVGDKVYVLDFPIIEVDVSSLTTIPRISVYDRSGNQLNSFDALGDPKAGPSSPTDISITSGNIFVSDTFHKAVIVYDLGGNYIGTVEDPAREIDTAVSLVISSEGILYVSSNKTHSVQMFEVDTKSGIGASAGKIGGTL